MSLAASEEYRLFGFSVIPPAYDPDTDTWGLASVNIDWRNAWLKRANYFFGYIGTNFLALDWVYLGL